MSLNFEGTAVQRPLVRKSRQPLDATSTFATYAEAAEYALDESGTYSYCPYAGQLIVTLAGGVDRDGNQIPASSEDYNKARLWRLKVGSVNSKGRQGYLLEEILGADRVADTTEHNEFQGGTQTFGAWIELLAGMTMGYSLATEKVNGETVVKTDSITGKPLYIDGEGNERGLADDMERIWLDSQGKGHMVISALKVLGTLEVSEIDVNHIKHSGGLFVNSRANIIVDSVEQLSGDRTKLTFVGQANGQTLFNLFEVGDLALSMTFNVLKEGASTPSEGKVVRWYWREVVAVDDTSITLAPQDASLPEMATPRKGDTVVQVGHVDAPEGAADDKKAHVASRQGLQVMGFSDTNGPFIAEYGGINAPTASITFDQPGDAIVYLSPKYHKLQGDVIKLKAGQGGTDVEMTANTIKTITQNLSVIANILDIQAGNVSATINGLDGRITANANAITLNANAIALKADNKWLLKMTKDSAGMYVIGENGQPVANGGRMVLVANSDGSIGAVTIASNGTMTYTENFTLKASNVDFTAGAINMNTAKFTIGTDTNVTLFQSGKIKTDYIDVNTLKAALINAGIINANEIVTSALTASATFNAQNATINNLTIGGNAVIGGRLNGCGGTFTGDISAASGEFGGSVVIKEGNTPRIKIDGTNIATNEEAGNTRIVHLAPNGLLVLVDQNQYVLVKTDGIEMRWGNDGVKLGSGGLKRYNGSEWVDMYAKPLTISVNSTTILPANVQNVVCSGSGFDITLPSGAEAGTQIMIKGTTSGGNYVTICPPSGETISTTDSGNNKRLYNDDCCWLTKLGRTWYWNYAEV